MNPGRRNKIEKDGPEVRGQSGQVTAAGRSSLAGQRAGRGVGRGHGVAEQRQSVQMWSGTWSNRSQEAVTEEGASRSKPSSWEGEKGQAEAKTVIS